MVEQSQNYIEVAHCRVCSGTSLTEVLDLNKQPLSNSYHNGEELERFPLKINVCNNCYHVQLSVVVNPDLLFKNYIYVSGTTNTLHKYFEDFVSLCEFYVPNKGKVLDIACNDGTQLDKFKQADWQTYGVDPAENLYNQSSKKHNVTCGYWNKEIATTLGESFDLITAQNVFAHVDDVHSFLQACKQALSEKGFLFIQTSQADMIIDGQFDTIYHEHLSFFNTKSMKICANINGFSLVDVKKVPIHGGSYVFILRSGEHDESRSIQEIRTENDRGLYEIDLYKKYAANCKKTVSEFLSKIEEFKNKGYKIIGYGAAAKGNTFLNFANVKLDYIVDDNSLKHGLKTPGMNIPICSTELLKVENPQKTVIVPLAWNFFKEIKNRVTESIGSKFLYMKYFPNMEIIT
jgi:2-polyprenyl-3-methyl-5-hydroxy-6-metoxy-1,4-benzoquinol methylase